MPLPLRGTGGFNSTEDKGTYDRALLRRSQPKLVHNNYGVKARIPARGGTWVEWRRMEKLSTTTTALTEGTITTETIPTITSVVATVAQYGQFFRSTDLVQDQAFDPIIAEATEVLGEAMGESLDLLTRNIITAGTNVQYASTAGSRGAVGSGMRMTAAEIREAMATLESNDAETIGGVYPLIIHPRVKADIFNDTNVVNAFLYAAARGDSNPMASGRLGNYLGAEFIVTSQARIFASFGFSAADVYASLLIGDGAYGVVELSSQTARTFFKPVGSGGSTGDPIDQVWSLGWKANHAAAILNQNFMVRIETTAALGVMG